MLWQSRSIISKNIQFIGFICHDSSLMRKFGDFIGCRFVPEYSLFVLEWTWLFSSSRVQSHFLKFHMIVYLVIPLTNTDTFFLVHSSNFHFLLIISFLALKHAPKNMLRHEIESCTWDYLSSYKMIEMLDCFEAHWTSYSNHIGSYFNLFPTSTQQLFYKCCAGAIWRWLSEYWLQYKSNPFII